MKHSASESQRSAFVKSPFRQRVSALLRLTISLATLLIFVTPARIVLSQSATTARISGTVTDANKAVLPGVEVELSDPTTNQRLKQTTDESGKYVFATVAPGVYSLTITKPGFRTTSFASVKVEVSKSYDLDAVLEVGEVKEIVQVTAGAEVELQKTDSHSRQRDIGRNNAALSGSNPPGKRVARVAAAGRAGRRSSWVASRSEHLPSGWHRYNQPVGRRTRDVRSITD
jgi:carboxypeptidase family protein